MNAVPAKYNEIDPYAAMWLRSLALAGHIPKGEVDERSITDLKAADVAGPGQRHFFAGIGVWPYALRLADWPDDANVWTGSCPCQPWSPAGAGAGADDARHLWPEWLRLIRVERPDAIVGEQVADGGGLAWLDVVSSDLEKENYAVGAFDLCAASVGAPHRRQRLYFGAIRLADDDSTGRRIIRPAWLHDRRQHGHNAARRGTHGGLVHADGFDAGRHAGTAARAQAKDTREGVERRRGRLESLDPSAAHFWSEADWLKCSDGKHRPVEPGTFPLADGTPATVEQLRAYGNACVGPLAAEFLRCFRDSLIELGAGA